jgi:hypothetical protein
VAGPLCPEPLGSHFGQGANLSTSDLSYAPGAPRPNARRRAGRGIDRDFSWVASTLDAPMPRSPTEEKQSGPGHALMGGRYCEASGPTLVSRTLP